jgi:PleD family two-component response regulator
VNREDSPVATPKQVLLADTDEAFGTLLARALTDRGHRVEHVDDGEQAMAKLVAESSFDTVVLPCILPGRSGLSICHELTRRRQGRPRVLFLLEVDDPQVRGLARICGASAVLPRSSDLEAIVSLIEAEPRRPDIKGLLGPREERIRKGEVQPETSLAVLLNEGTFLDDLIDPDTGVYKTSYLILKLQEEFKRTSRYGLPLACALLRVDPNAEDVFGRVAGTLLTECRDTDVVGRVGKSDLLVLLPGTNGSGARSLVLRLLRSVGIPVGGSLQVGIGTHPSPGVETAENLVRMAEGGMVKASAFQASDV